MRYCGYIAVVKVDSDRKDKIISPVQSYEIGDQPEGGSNALNINRLFVSALRFPFPFSSSSSRLT